MCSKLRFLREGDKMTSSLKSQIYRKWHESSAELKLYDALTEQEISVKMIEAVAGPFPKLDTEISLWKRIKYFYWMTLWSEGYSAIKYKLLRKQEVLVMAKKWLCLCLLTYVGNRSMPLPIRSNQTKEFIL